MLAARNGQAWDPFWGFGLDMGARPALQPRAVWGHSPAMARRSPGREEGTGGVGFQPRRVAFALLIAVLIAASARPASALADDAEPFTLHVPRLTVSSDFLPLGEDPGQPQADPFMLAQASPGAGAPAAQPQPASILGRAPLRQGSWEAGAALAYSLSSFGGPNIGTVVRAVWLLPSIGYTFAEVPWGSFQVYLVPQGAFIITPQKTYLIGLAALVRHTFYLSRRFMPYIDGGAGFLNTNLRTRSLGESIEFDPQGGVGFYLHLTERVSLNAGFRFHHISNAGLGERNLGINSYFPYAGFSYFF